MTLRRSCEVVLFGALVSGTAAHAMQQTTLPADSLPLPLPRATATAPVLRLSVRTSPEPCQLNTYIAGPFGGYLAAGLRTNVRDIPLAVTVGEARARSAKAIVFCPGYGFALVDLPAVGASRTVVQIDLTPRSEVALRGTIAFPDPAATPGLRLRLRYVMYWAHGFFGITDGMVPFVALGTHPVNADGSFELLVPDVATDPALTDVSYQGSFQLEVIDVRTGAPVYHLRTGLDHALPALHIPAGRRYPFLLIQATPIRDD
jgi:hypothetical protein